MLKIAFILVAIFGSSQSTSFECHYDSNKDGYFKTIYHCKFPNSISITSPHEAQIDSISGTHMTGYNNDNVEGFYAESYKDVNYFPRGLSKFFKNLRVIRIISSGLKEVHQSDLKEFPNLTHLYLYKNSLEILEENLFEFNPNLELIDLGINKISHIDPNVFNKLTKLKTLDFYLNTCIGMSADNNPTELQKVIKAAKSQCKNINYSKLEKKVKNLEIESENLNFGKLKKRIESLENEVKNSKFLNFFQDKLEGLKDKQIEKIQKEVPDKLTKIDEKLTIVNEKISNLKSDILSPKNDQPANIQKLEKIQKLAEYQSQKIVIIESKLTTIDQHVTKVDEATSKFNKDTITTLKDIESFNSQNFGAIMNFIENLSKKMEAIEVKLTGIDSTQKKVMNKIHKIESDSRNSKLEINQKLKAILNGV